MVYCLHAHTNAVTPHILLIIWGYDDALCTYFLPTVLVGSQPPHARPCESHWIKCGGESVALHRLCLVETPLRNKEGENTHTHRLPSVIAVGSLATFFPCKWGKTHKIIDWGEKRRDTRGTSAEGADMNRWLSFCLCLSHSVWSGGELARGSQMGASCQSSSKCRYMCASWRGGMTLVFNKKKVVKRGEDGVETERKVMNSCRHISTLDQCDNTPSVNQRHQNQKRLYFPRTRRIR